LEVEGGCPSIDHKSLEKQTGFLNHLAMTFEDTTPFLKGFYLTLNSWRRCRDQEGWKVATHFDPAGISFKLTFLNPFVTLFPLPVLLTAATTVTSSANTLMMPPFLIQPVNGGSFGITSLPLPMASLISVIVSFSTLLLPLTLLLTSLGLMSFPFLILPFAFSDQSPFQSYFFFLPDASIFTLGIPYRFMCLMWHPIASPFISAYESFPLGSPFRPSSHFILMSFTSLHWLPFFTAVYWLLLAPVDCCPPAVCCLLNQNQTNKLKTAAVCCLLNQNLLSAVCCLLSVVR
jgi:hypothetical protein